MSYSQDHQSESVRQKYPATILQVIKGMIGEGCMRLLGPCFSHLRKPVTDLSWWFIFSSLSTGSSQEWTLMSCFHCSFLPPLYLTLAVLIPFFPAHGRKHGPVSFVKFKWVISSQLPKRPAKCPRKVPCPLKSFLEGAHQSLKHCIFWGSQIHPTNILHKANVREMLPFR